MAQTDQLSRSTNINIRVAPAQRNLIDQAASLSNKTRTEFILDAVTRAAKDAILDQVLFRVSAEQFLEFQRLLDSPPSSNERLKALISRKPRWEK